MPGGGAGPEPSVPQEDPMPAWSAPVASEAPASAGGTAVPAPPPGEVPRNRLLARLRPPTGLVVVTAPAGYGKTVLLAQLARQAEVPVAWIGLRGAHRDPRRLDADVRASLPAGGGPALLVLDDVDAIATSRGLAGLSALLSDLPAGTRVAVGCRTDAGLGLGRRLVEGRLTRLTADDLAFDADEAGALMAAAGVTLDPGALEVVLGRTEGWPAGLRIAALRVGRLPDPSAGARAFTGDDRIVAAYLHEVVLAGLPAETLAFLTRTSVLEPITGDLCDAVLGTSGAAGMLEDLERSDVPLVALDGRGERYRHHRLLGDLLRRELRRREPGMAEGLHRRAGAWHEAAGDLPSAVRHALAAGDRDHAVRLVWAAVPAGLTRGRMDALQAMLASFAVDDVASLPELATAAAWCHVETRGDLAVHGLTQAERAAAAAGAGAPASLVPALAALRAMLGRDGVTRMGRDAAGGAAAGADGEPWGAWCRLLQGVACHLGGEPRRARGLLEDAAERAGRLAPAVHAMALAQLALLLLEEDEPVRALMLARRSRTVVEEWGLAAQKSASLTWAALALALARSDRPEEAREHIRDARGLLAETLDACAWRAVEVRAAVAHAALAVGDDEVAREAVSGVEGFVGRLAEAPLLRDEVELLRRRVQPVPEGDAALLSSITAAEARVLQLLPTHHSIREIGDLLFLSRFTVKSHAHSLYRKLGVSGRSEAVERARQLSILPPA